LDVVAVENELVVFHDTRLERCTNGRGRVADASIFLLRSLDAGKGERIPFLREVMDLLRGRAGVNIELKGPGTAVLAASLIADEVRAGRWSADRLLVSSFRRPELRQFRNLQPGIPAGYLVGRITLGCVRAAVRFGCSSLHLAVSQVSRNRVRKAHRCGLKVYVYTVNDTDGLERFFNLGVDGIFTDRPNLALGFGS
jgi:glycerophosphoryl diester phosphodiesterase